MKKQHSAGSLDVHQIQDEYDLENAIIRLYGGVYKRKNPFPGATKDFGKLCIIFNIFIPVLKIILGLHYLDDCPVNKYIPYYMFVGGILQLLFMVTIVFRKQKYNWPFQIVIGTALVVWFLIAITSTYFEWEPDYYKSGYRYCNEVIYTFAVIACLIDLVSVVLILFFMCILLAFEMP